MYDWRYWSLTSASAKQQLDEINCDNKQQHEQINVTFKAMTDGQKLRDSVAKPL